MLGSQGARSIRSYVGQVAVVPKQSFREPGSGAHDVIIPLPVGSPRWQSSGNPEAILMAKLSSPRTQAVLTATSPLCSGTSTRTMEGTVTLPLASCVKPR